MREMPELVAAWPTLPPAGCPRLTGRWEQGILHPSGLASPRSQVCMPSCAPPRRQASPSIKIFPLWMLKKGDTLPSNYLIPFSTAFFVDDMPTATLQPEPETKKKERPVHGIFSGMKAGFFVGLVVPMFLSHMPDIAKLNRPEGGYIFIVIMGVTAFLAWPILRRLGKWRGVLGLISGLLIGLGIRIVLRGGMTSGFCTLFESHFYYLTDMVAAISLSDDWRSLAETDHARAQGTTAAFNAYGGSATVWVATVSAIALHVWFVCRILNILGDRWSAEAEQQSRSEAAAAAKEDLVGEMHQD